MSSITKDLNLINVSYLSCFNMINARIMMVSYTLVYIYSVGLGLINNHGYVETAEDMAHLH